MEAKFLICCLIISVISVLHIDANHPKINIEQQRNNSYFQGDIIMSRKQRNGILKANRWPDGIIPYQCGSFEQEHLDLIQEAMRAIEASTCIRFVKRTNETDYIYIVNTKGGCSSGVGRVGGFQPVSLMHIPNRSTCMNHKTIVHELLHAVGLWHEQMRVDRDQYITINWDNIETDNRHNFDMVSATDTNTYGIPYNYLSVMHYSAYAFSSNDGITMQPKDDKYTDIIGNIAYGHELDWEKVRRIYDCKGTYTPAPTTTAAPTTPVMCIDTISYCDSLVKQNMCTTESYMREYCRKSCGFCKEGQPLCQDKITYCRSYKKECGKLTWLNDYCEKTCHVC